MMNIAIKGPPPSFAFAFENVSKSVCTVMALFEADVCAHFIQVQLLRSLDTSSANTRSCHRTTAEEKERGRQKRGRAVKV